MIAVSAWVWAALAIVVFLVLGILLALFLGLVGMPGDAGRRTAQRARAGDALPDEVPRASAEETAERAEDDRA